MFEKFPIFIFVCLTLQMCIRDRLDRLMKWEGEAKNLSRVRRILHGSSHWLMGVGKKLYGNTKGA